MHKIYECNVMETIHTLIKLYTILETQTTTKIYGWKIENYWFVYFIFHEWRWTRTVYKRNTDIFVQKHEYCRHLHHQQWHHNSGVRSPRTYLPVSGMCAVALNSLALTAAVTFVASIQYIQHINQPHEHLFSFMFEICVHVFVLQLKSCARDIESCQARDVTCKRNSPMRNRIIFSSNWWKIDRCFATADSRKYWARDHVWRAIAKQLRK